jgi:hypothetical protein
MIPIPADQFGMDGCQAIMTTRDFFVITDQLFDTASQWNPENLSNNYFLHHWQVISASRFVPAVMFHTGADDAEPIVITPPTSVATPTIEQIDGADVTTAERGQLIALQTTITPDEAAQSVVWTVSGNNSRRTYITPYGVLHVAPEETASSVTVTATSTWVDPENPRLDPVSATKSVTLSGEVLDSWPIQSQGISAIEIAGESVSGVAPGTTTYTLTVPSGTTVNKDKVKVATKGSADVDVSVSGSAATGYVVTIKVDPGTGAATTYTVNVTVG